MNADFYRDALKDVVQQAEQDPQKLSAIGEMMERLEQPEFKMHLQQLGDPEQWETIQTNLGTGRQGIEFLTPRKLEGWILKFLDFAKWIESMDKDPDAKMIKLIKQYTTTVTQSFVPALSQLVSVLHNPFPDPSTIRQSGKSFIKIQAKLEHQQKNIKRHAKSLKGSQSTIGQVFWTATKQALLYSLVAYVTLVEVASPQELRKTWNLISSILGEDTWLSSLFQPAMYTADSPNPVSHFWIAWTSDKLTSQDLMIQPPGFVLGATHSAVAAISRFLANNVTKAVIDFMIEYIVPLISAPLLISGLSAAQNPYVWWGLKTVIVTLLTKWFTVDAPSVWAMAAFNRLSDWWDLSRTEKQLAQQQVMGYQCSDQTMCIPAHSERDAQYQELSECLSACQ
ncbi:MAG: hypothetical protein K0U52_13240, partial [Gammaproteobacteria bacterium]|nr:hypothetical protein [Gammaproteobacteria bacterium]